MKKTCFNHFATTFACSKNTTLGHPHFFLFQVKVKVKVVGKLGERDREREREKERRIVEVRE